MNTRLILAVCGYEQIPFSFISQLATIYSEGYIPIVTAQGLYIQTNRNVAVNKALTQEWDYLLFLDTDMIFPKNMIDRVRTYKDPVVGGMYWRRKYPDYTPVPGNFKDGDKPQFNQLSPEELLPMLDKPGLYPVDVLGTGCLAIRRDVIENWPEDMLPIFNTMQSTDGEDTVTEDVYFCWRLKQMGIQPKLDTEICCGHIGPIVIGKNSYRNVLEQGQST